MSNKDIYLKLFSQEPEKFPVLFSPWWLDAVCGEENWDVLLYSKGDKIYGLWPYFRTKQNIFNKILQPGFTQYNGPLLFYPEGLTEVKRLEFEKKVISNLIDILPKEVDMISINSNPLLLNWLPFYWRGFRQTTRYTYATNSLSGKDEEALLQTYTKDVRKSIKKFQSQGFVYKDAKDVNFSSRDFFLLHKECLMKINRKISYTEELLKRMVDYSVSNKSGKLIVVQDENNHICGATFFIYNSFEAVGINTAADHTIRDLGYFLNHLCILEASKLVGSYNIGGSMIEGVEKTYRQFGLHQTPYFNISKEISKRYKIYSAVRNFGKAILR